MITSGGLGTMGFGLPSAIQGPVLIDFVVNQEENVYPMVVPGGTIDEMIMGDEK
ncbi:hypothetical protein P5G65_20905 [Paenibacillus chondroitinus]|uniref:Uncharacterized protein n=1 Tax=Paenibacillus chondroitinus TaxID=59842 RepID=A0ABU6DF42_9BACL|nr:MULTISPECIES: hypothetical protein [Paenibacillus]MCY9659295.1 hypothetical protein [Paenibacillus anseongense]MEB4796369.1 hypothetical protein [Paenibacillus chondroitinus]